MTFLDFCTPRYRERVLRATLATVLAFSGGLGPLRSASAQGGAAEPQFHTIVIIAADGTISPVVGKWRVDFPTEERVFTIALTASRGVLTGALTMVAQDGTRNVEIYEGRLTGSTLSFKMKTPNGNRTLTFTGTVAGDRMQLTRDVFVPADGILGGAGIFGAQGATEFSARRVP